MTFMFLVRFRNILPTLPKLSILSVVGINIITLSSAYKDFYFNLLYYVVVKWMVSLCKPLMI